MSKKYNDTGVESSVSTFQNLKEINRSEVQNVLSKKSKLAINFDDKKYGVKTFKVDPYLLSKKQEPLKLGNFLKGMPIIGRFFLARNFTPEYERLQSQMDSSSEEKDIDSKRTEEIDSKLEDGNVEQVDTKKKNLVP